MARWLTYVGIAAVSWLVLRGPGGITLGDALIIGAILLIVPNALIDLRTVEISILPVAGAVAIVLGGILSSWHSSERIDSFLVLARVVFVTIVLPALFFLVFPTVKLLRRAVIWTTLGAALCGAGTFAQVISPEIIPGSMPTTASRFPGLAVHVSDTGAITSLAVVAGAGLLLSSTSWKCRIFTGILTIFGIVGVVLSGSVSGMLASLVGLVVLFILRNASAQTLLNLSAVAFMGVALIYPLIKTFDNALGPGERVMQVFGQSGSSTELNTVGSRAESIISALSQFQSSPLLGAGLSMDFTVAALQSTPHNLFVTTLYQGGALFAMGIALVVINGIMKAWRCRYYAPSIVALVASSLFFAMTAPSYYNRYFWLPLALIIVTDSVRVKQELLAKNTSGAV
ncbi:O-antigen ligase family protein [Kocuria rosea]|uniref:O-antigen ligase family protein n=1 Tax=Kocuria rosea TaxID=1275 RepID=UPI0025B755DA|nr:O-antigen ligase family protein [Kocuria rosea]WJZ65490.1 O-antigen ligase family protein [Kocuria rosea]